MNNKKQLGIVIILAAVGGIGFFIYSMLPMITGMVTNTLSLIIILILFGSTIYSLIKVIKWAFREEID